MPDFYHIYIKYKNGLITDLKRKTLESKLNLALDWYRVSESVYVIYTTRTAKDWNVRLKPLILPSGYVFIAKIDINDRSGWMPKPFWEWIRTAKNKHPGS